MLADTPDQTLAALDRQPIQTLLSTTTFGRTLHIFPQTPSTNDDAKALALQGAPEGTVVLAEEQFQGRGRQGRSFASPSGVGIYLSLLLRPTVDPNRLPQLTLMVGVAVAEALVEITSLDVCLKWPNDVEVHGKKVAGILTEGMMRPDRQAVVIVGIGINVNTTLAQFPEDLQARVTSLALAAGHRFDRPPLIASLLGHLETYYHMFQDLGMAPILQRWLHYGPIIGRRVRFTQDDATQQHATVVGLDEDGALRVQLDDGRQERLIAGRAEFL
jgi:BirA family biotin operon repressor/biotin-[acetyl-CoA-carboxylase] ligase